MDHNVPFVVVAGTGSSDAAKETPKSDSITFSQVANSPIVTGIVAELSARSSTSGPWLPGLQRLRVVQSQILDLPKKQVPSILSPRNPESPLYPAGIFTDQWVTKYTTQIPTTVVLVISLDQSDEDIINQVEDLRTALTDARSHIVLVVDTTDKEDSQARLAALRKSTGLAARTGLIAVNNLVNISQVCDSLWQLLSAQAADFFAARSRETRHKRTSADSSDLWEARYTLKLAFFAEFKADYEGAIRLYQSAYECLEIVDGSSKWLDICAHKIYLFLIYYQRYGQAWAKFQHHLKLSDDPQWQATQYYAFAQTLAYSVVEWWAVAPDNTGPAGAVPRPGFLYLRAAKLATDPSLAKSSFEAAIEDFAPMPHSRAVASNDYAAWLETNEPEAASKYYEQALRVLPQNSRLHIKIANKLAHYDKNNSLAGFFLFFNGAAPLVKGAQLGAIEIPLFDVSGTFMSKTAYIGKPLVFQLSMTPRFKGKLTLETIKIQFSSTSLVLNHTDSGAAKELITEKNANLTFDGSPKTFELSVMPTEVGDFEFVDIQVHGLDINMDQRLLVTPTLDIITENGIRHKWVTPLRFVQVQTRPQLLQVDTSEIPAVLYTHEETSIKFKIYNDEDETANVKITASWNLLADGVLEEFYSAESSISSHVTKSFETKFKTPKDAFNLVITTEYTTESNGSPVSMNTSAEVEVVKPFRVNFALLPEIHSEQWPNIFVPSDHCAPLPLIRRRWSLNATILSMCEDPITIKTRNFECVSQQASITSLQGVHDINVQLNHNDQTTTDLHFEAMRKDRDVRTFEAEGVVILAWYRTATPHILNHYAVPAVKLLLPNQEPRVLMGVDFDNESGLIDLSYFIENATSHVLNFAVSMPSAQGFMVRGIRATNLRLLPFSRQRLDYRLYPLQNPLSHPIPELRVFDTTYKKVLTVIPDSAKVTTENGVSRVKAFNLPL